MVVHWVGRLNFPSRAFCRSGAVLKGRAFAQLSLPTVRSTSVRCQKKRSPRLRTPITLCRRDGSSIAKRLAHQIHRDITRPRRGPRVHALVGLDRSQRWLTLLDSTSWKTSREPIGGWKSIPSFIPHTARRCRFVRLRRRVRRRRQDLPPGDQRYTDREPCLPNSSAHAVSCGWRGPASIDQLRRASH